jgi:hypothetical protein
MRLYYKETVLTSVCHCLAFGIASGKLTNCASGHNDQHIPSLPALPMIPLISRQLSVSPSNRAVYCPHGNSGKASFLICAFSGEIKPLPRKVVAGFCLKFLLSEIFLKKSREFTDVLFQDQSQDVKGGQKTKRFYRF